MRNNSHQPQQSAIVTLHIFSHLRACIVSVVRKELNKTFYLTIFSTRSQVGTFSPGASDSLQYRILIVDETMYIIEYSIRRYTK